MSGTTAVVVTRAPSPVPTSEPSRAPSVPVPAAAPGGNGEPGGSSNLASIIGAVVGAVVCAVGYIYVFYVRKTKTKSATVDLLEDHVHDQPDQHVLSVVPPLSAPAPVEAFAVTVDESSTAMTMKQWLDSVNMGFGDMFHDKFFEVGLDSVNILASGEIILAHFRRCCAFNNDVPR